MKTSRPRPPAVPLTGLTRFLFLGVLVAVVGCAPNRRPIEITPGLEGPRHATMEVRNDHRHEIEVSVIRSDGGTPLRLGEVDPNSDRGFRLPMPLNGEPVRMQVRCRVSDSVHETHEIVWRPTQRVALAIGSYLPLTRLALR